MDDRLRDLILEAWEHDHLPGPETDLAYQDRCRIEWIATLTAEDCLALAGWLSDPVIPAEWGIAEDWHSTLVRSIPHYLGRAGRRLDDPRIREAVLELIRSPRSRRVGLECARELGTPELFPELLHFLGDTALRTDVCLALAAVATPAQVEHLRSLEGSNTLAPELRCAITEAITEWEMAEWDRTNTVGQGAAANRPHE